MTRLQQAKTSHFAAIAAAIAFSAAGTAFAAAQERTVPDTYLAVTTNMTPADIELKADILHWADDSERAAVIAALQSEDPSAALRELPSMGAIWRSNSSIGNSIKYAHRAEMPDGSQIVTLVTDKRIAYSTFRPWTANTPSAAEPLDYSVVELNLGGAGEGRGTLSLNAAVRIDPEANLISLDRGDLEPLLTNVRLAPKPYWATAP